MNISCVSNLILEYIEKYWKEFLRTKIGDSLTFNLQAKTIEWSDKPDLVVGNRNTVTDIIN